ncbi:hypothetical protein DMENIID0001_114820 [Sergentomyia squamirostris]
MTEDFQIVNGVIRNFKDYAKNYIDRHEPYMHLPELNDLLYVPDCIERELCLINWQIIIARSRDNKFRQISFINGRETPKGGHHVDAVIKVLLCEIRHKKLVLVGEDEDDDTLKNNIWLFINFNPSNSHQNEYPECILNSGIRNQFIEQFLYWSAFQLPLSQIENFVDATLDESHAADRTLWLVEGQSAMVYVWGKLKKTFNESERNSNGILALRGKLKKAKNSTDWITNKTLRSLMIVLGLRNPINGIGERYKKIIILSDNDCAGRLLKYHIIQFLTFISPNILNRINVEQFLVPAVVLKSKQHATQDLRKYWMREEFDSVMKNTTNRNFITENYTIFDDFGSFVNHDDFLVEEYALHRKNHIVKILWDPDSDYKLLQEFRNGYDSAIAAFRNNQNENPMEGQFLYSSQKLCDNISMTDFLKRDILPAWKEECNSNIYCLASGLKYSQQLILFTSLTELSNKRMTCTVFAGTVKDKTTYSHRVKHLEPTIKDMTRKDINWLPLLKVVAGKSDGTSHQISSEYNRVTLSDYARLVFRGEDFEIADKKISYFSRKLISMNFVSIVPLFLLNSVAGIFTTGSLPCSYTWIYKIEDIISNLELLDENEEPSQMTPSFPNYSGWIYPTDGGGFKSVGKAKYACLEENKLEVYVLPLRMTNKKYKIILESLKRHHIIEDFKDDCDGEEKTKFIVEFSPANFNRLQKETTNFYVELQLECGLESGNLVALDKDLQRQFYMDELDMLRDYHAVTVESYMKRDQVHTREEAIEQWRKDRRELMDALPTNEADCEENVVLYVSSEV